MLEEKILSDYKQAMKDKDTLKSSVLSFLRAEMINVAMAKKKKSLEDNDVIAVIRKQSKQRQDSIEQFTKGGRAELADKETKELEILKNYLPKEIPAEEIQKIIEEAVVSTGAGGIKDMGKVMKEVLAKVGAQADSKTVSELVRARLSKPAV
ncbi:MAG: GatB/YqeY domain-containing protein [Candidatus Omnitrophica bacterium]|nr:GatB/YqeY domain-containing protein [Candidatus Omnitrophota bacterium]MBL7210459.1 GatB/YqeY domain-containing protein [Candidatus Omnitrophota bacterium]